MGQMCTYSRYRWKAICVYISASGHACHWCDAVKGKMRLLKEKRETTITEEAKLVESVDTRKKNGFRFWVTLSDTDNNSRATNKLEEQS